MRRVLEVDRGDARLRLDRLLVARLPEAARLSRTRLSAWIREGRVEVDGVPTALYGVAAAVLCWRFRSEILRYRATLPFFVVGGFFLGATSLLNVGEASSVQIVVEESAKLLGVVSFLLGHLAALAGVIREHALEAAT